MNRTLNFINSVNKLEQIFQQKAMWISTNWEIKSKFYTHTLYIELDIMQATKHFHADVSMC